MSQQSNVFTKATAIKRILAFIYDLFLIIPLMMLTALFWLPFNNGLAIEPGNSLYPLMISSASILTPILFYTYFWYKGGQTLGMKSWKLKIVSANGKPLTKNKVRQEQLFLFFHLHLSLSGLTLHTF